MASDEQPLVVELRFIAENMAVHARCHRQVPLADELADPGPRNAAQVQETDPPMPQIVRAEEWNAGRSARLCDRSAKRVRARAGEETRARLRSSRGPSWPSSASASTSGSSIQSALRLFVVAARRRTRRRGSS